VANVGDISFPIRVRSIRVTVGRRHASWPGRRAWQREKMIRDPVYRANQKQSQADWQSRNADYWKRYRAAHPEQADRNRDLQQVRNKRRYSQGVDKMDVSVIAKMDASRSGKSSVGAWLSGSFWLVPVIAKMDAIKVILHRIPST